jgi:hypothetical protein
MRVQLAPGSRGKFRLSPFKRRTAALLSAVAVAAGLCLVGTVPANASCGASGTFDYVQYQWDNCPGDGAQAWTWIYLPVAGSIWWGRGATLDASLTVWLADGQEQTISTVAGKSNVGEWWDAVSAAMICRA